MHVTTDRTMSPASPDGADRLSRLKAFLKGVEAVEIVSPEQGSTATNYLRRFFQRIAAPIALGSALAVALPAAAAGQVPAGQQLVSEAKSILSGVRSISSRYLAHGRTPGNVTVQAVSPDFQPQRGLLAKITMSQCTIEGIRLDYSKVDRVLACMTAAPELRAFVLIHEHTHCRTSPSFLMQVRSHQAENLAANFREASSDAMAILMIARRDGVPTALATLQTVYAVRMIEAAHDPIHDTRATLSNIELVLKSQPARFASDARAFETALIESARGAAHFHDERRRNGLTAPLSKEEERTFAATLERVAEGYLSGKGDARDTELRAMGFRPAPAATPSSAAGADPISIDPGRIRLAAESALSGIGVRGTGAVVLAQVSNPATRIRALYDTQRFRSGPLAEDQEEVPDAPRQQ